MHHGPFTWSEWRVGLKPRKAWKSKPGIFISSGTAAASRRSRRRKIRACIFASILAVRPFSQSSARALLLKLLIIVYARKLLADRCQQLAYVRLARACKPTSAVPSVAPSWPRQQLRAAVRDVMVPRLKNVAHL